MARRHQQRRLEARHYVEPSHETNELPERSFVVLLPRLLRAHGGDASRDGALEFAQFLRPVARVLRLERVLEPYIEHQPLVHFHHGVLIRRALAGFGLLPLFPAADAFALPVHRFERRLDLVPRVMFAVLAILFVLLRQLEQGEEFGVIDTEDGPLIGRVRFHHHVGEPFNGGDDLRPQQPERRGDGRHEGAVRQCTDRLLRAFAGGLFLAQLQE